MPTSQLKLFQTAVMQSWSSVVITDADIAAGCRVQIANPAFCRMTGYTLEELTGRSLKLLQGPDTDAEVIDRLRTCLREERYFEGTAVNYRKDGSTYTVHWNITPIHDEDGMLTHFMSVQQDITAYLNAESKNRLLALALDATSDPVILTDAQANILFVNQAFSQVTGYSTEEVMGKTPALLRSGKHDQDFYKALRETLTRGDNFRATFINRRHDGALYHAEQSISPISDAKGHITHYISVSKDISDRVGMEEALREAAIQDKLTGLYNRRHGEQLLAEAFKNAMLKERPLNVIVCDIDHFKQINDRFGHLAGDRVLAKFGQILRQSVRGNDAVIRWGGEEFVILINDCPQAPAIERVERIRGCIEAHQDEVVGSVTMSFGLATLIQGETIEQAVARADAALYEAKHAGRNRLSVA